MRSLWLNREPFLLAGMQTLIAMHFTLLPDLRGAQAIKSLFVGNVLGHEKMALRAEAGLSRALHHLWEVWSSVQPVHKQALLQQSTCKHVRQHYFNWIWSRRNSPLVNGFPPLPQHGFLKKDVEALELVAYFSSVLWCWLNASSSMTRTAPKGKPPPKIWSKSACPVESSVWACSPAFVPGPAKFTSFLVYRAAANFCPDLMLEEPSEGT